MGPLVIIIALEIVFTTGILGLSSHKFSNVLGVRKIAQAEDNSPAPESPQTPAPASTPSSPESSPASPESSPAPAPASSVPTASSPATSDQTPAATPNQSPSEQTTQTTPEQIPSPSETPGLQENSSAVPPQSSGEFSPSPSNETSTSQTQAVLAPDELIKSPEHINNTSLEEVKKEDTQLNQTTDPQQQNKLLVNFATDKVKDMNNFAKADDFTSTNFAAQRFNEQMDKAISNLEKVPPKDQALVKKQLVNFCSQADQVLRTVGLSVPEEGEQDLEIARGQCQELSL